MDIPITNLDTINTDAPCAGLAPYALSAVSLHLEGGKAEVLGQVKSQ